MASFRAFCCTWIAAVLFCGAACAATAEQKEIIELYRRGLAGDATAVEECIAKLEAVLKTQPANQLARVYLGSALTLRSRDLGFGPRKLQALKQGVALMDEAVAAAPNESKVRLARALTTSALPAIFGHGASARADFLLLADAALREPGGFDEGDLQLVFYEAGLAAKKNGEAAKAIEFWTKGRRHPHDARIAQKIDLELAKTK
jgi:hypothetical protein